MSITRQFQISGQVYNYTQRRFFPGEISIRQGKIVSIRENTDAPKQFIIPPFIDSHVHVESSMLSPRKFAEIAVIHGTAATVSDPHEIANVLGTPGVHWMISDGNSVPFKFYFGAPSCVPATNFETAGATIDATAVDQLLAMPEVRYLSEMMNYPGVLHGDSQVMAKIAAAKKHGKVIDGHAPGLRGELAKQYAAAGISSDHECFTEEEARDKIDAGMSILIREGSAAKNFDALIGLLPEFPEKIMFCSDDKHPNDLLRGHINELAKRALAMRIPFSDVIAAVAVNPIKHYGLSVGLLQVGDPADFLVIDNLDDLRVLSTYINGIEVARNGSSLISSDPPLVVNAFRAARLRVEDIQILAEGKKLRAIEVIPGQLVTSERIVETQKEDAYAISSPKNDLLKLVVLNRYRESKPACAFVHAFGLRQGAIASSVAHDCHNIIAVGASDEDLIEAINLLIESRGGISAACGEEKHVVPLPIAGLMSTGSGKEIGAQYEALDRLAKSWGSTLPAPYMTLSFLALLVIPDLKLSDLGLFDGKSFEFRSLFVS